MNLLLFAGSLRTGSLNKKLLAAAGKILADQADCKISVMDIKSLSLPVYDGDIEAVGLPEGVKTLGQEILRAEALVIASPEYNASISSPLKNTVDWVSRLKPIPWDRKPVLLMGASPGYFGGMRALIHTRPCFETLGAYVYPQVFALPKAHEAFATDGGFSDEGNKKKLTELLSQYLQFAQRLTKK